MGDQPAGQIEQYYGTGKRKCSVARVFLRPGKGDFLVNGRPMGAYFLGETQRAVVQHPLQVVELLGKFDVFINVRGGGVVAQAGAARLGITRALMVYDAALRANLKKMGFVTRDARIKERKKYGQKGARKRFQFSKR